MKNRVSIIDRRAAAPPRELRTIHGLRIFRTPLSLSLPSFYLSLSHFLYPLFTLRIYIYSETRTRQALRMQRREIPRGV